MIPTQKTIKVMKFLSSVESWNSLFEWASVLLVGLTFVAGAGTVISSRIINKKQSLAIAELKLAAEQQAKTNLELEKANIEARSDLEKEHAARVEMEKSIAPRLIPRRLNFQTGTDNLAELKPFAPTKVIVRFLPDAEASRAASNIVEILDAVGWKVENIAPKPDAHIAFFDGVVIESHLPKWHRDAPDAQPRPPTPEESHPRNSAVALAKFLTTNTWVARVNVVGDKDELPSDTIRVTVGFKPAPYFAPKTDSGIVISPGQGGLKVVVKAEVKRINDVKALKLLKPAPKGTVKLVYVAGNQGAKELAQEMAGVLRRMKWGVFDPEEIKEPSSVTGILMEVSAEGWADMNPIAPPPQDARALERFLSECIASNSGVSLTAKDRNNEPVYMTAATPGASLKTPLEESSMPNVKGEILVVIGPQN